MFATLHTNSAVDSIDRIVSVFPEGRQRQIRIQLASTLKVVLSQQLLPMPEGGRVAACEVMVVNDAIRNLIREGKTPQMESFITMNSKEGSILMDNAVAKLLREGKITAEAAEKHIRTKRKLHKRITILINIRIMIKNKKKYEKARESTKIAIFR